MDRKVYNENVLRQSRVWHITQGFSVNSVEDVKYVCSMDTALRLTVQYLGCRNVSLW